MVGSEFSEEDHKKYEAETYFKVFAAPARQPLSLRACAAGA
jgi:hypothetical protein